MAETREQLSKPAGVKPAAMWAEMAQIIGPEWSNLQPCPAIIQAAAWRVAAARRTYRIALAEVWLVRVAAVVLTLICLDLASTARDRGMIAILPIGFAAAYVATWPRERWGREQLAAAIAAARVAATEARRVPWIAG